MTDRTDWLEWRRSGIGASDVAGRFLNKTILDGDCWLWTAGKHPAGYGKFALTHRQTVLAHRFAYELAFGPIPAGLQIDHLCKVTSCVNPSHLEVVTAKVNQERRVEHITHCPQGHPYSGQNLYLPGDGGKRQCRECRREAVRRHRAKGRQAA